MIRPYMSGMGYPVLSRYYRSPLRHVVGSPASDYYGVF